MKRILFCLAVCILSTSLWAEETTDYIKISSATVAPGGAEVKLTVSLEGGEHYYSAYNMDIHLPEGMEVAYKNNKPRVAIIASSAKASSFYPSTEEEEEDDEGESKTVYKYTHSLACSYGVVADRVLRVACYSNVNESFKDVSGDLFTVWVKAGSYAKPGKAQITIDGVALKVAGGSEYDPAARIDENVIIGTESTVSLNISSSDKWATCVVPFDAALPEDVQAFSCSATKDESTLALSEENMLKAYTPYILYAEKGHAGSLSGTVDASKYVETCTAGFLTGAIVAQKITDGYVLQNQDNGKGMMFYGITNNTEFTIPSGKCWLSIPFNVRSFDFWHTTSLTKAQQEDGYVEVFDLCGRPVKEMKAGGIYVVNGQIILSDN